MADETSGGVDANGEDGSEIDSFLREAARSPAARLPSADPAQGGLIGQRLGRFEIVAVLGQGGMGVVYRAEDTSLRRPVALKVLPADKIGDPERRRRFLREARAAAAVTHPNIATVYDAGEVGELLFLAMELVDGKSLRAALSERTAAGHVGFPWAEVVRIGLAVAHGVAKAHAARIVHRDIKPENVVLSRDGQIKVLDFGLAKFQPREDVPTEVADTASAMATEEGRVLGTPGYMPPEQARGKPIDARADVFSIGVTLFELATGQRPFDGRGLDAIIAIDRDEAPSLREAVSDAPPLLEAVIARCLAKDPADRYLDAGQLAVALAAAQPEAQQQDATSEGSARERRATLTPAERRAISGATPAPATTAGSVASPRRRSRAWIAVGLATLVAALGVLAALRFVQQRAASEAQASASSAPIPQPNPLERPGSVLACPQLEVEGVVQPSGWLGAAVAHHICRRSTVLFGGQPRRVLVPAELLGLPATPTKDFPRDPYGAKDARDVSLAAARKRGAAWLDGRVQVTNGAYAVSVTLRRPDGAAIGTASATHAIVGEAVRELVGKLQADGTVPVAETDPEIARWSAKVPGLDDRLRIFDIDAALDRSDHRSACAWADENRTRLGPHAAARLIDFCNEFGSYDRVAAPLDRTSPAAIVSTMTAGAAAGHELELARELRAAFDQEPSVHGRQALAEMEGHLHEATGNAAAAHERFIVAMSLGAPSDSDSLLGGFRGLLDGPDGVEGTAFVAAWQPHSAGAWNMVSRSFGPTRLLAAKRMYALAAGNAWSGTTYGEILIEAGLREEARGVAALLSASREPEAQLASQVLSLRVDASEARFRAAFERVLAVVPQLDTLDTAAEYRLLLVGRELAELLGRERELGDAFARRAVLGDEPLLNPSSPFGPMAGAPTCALASPAVRTACLTRIRFLIRDGYFLRGLGPFTDEIVTGFEAWAKNDRAGAVAAWRPLTRSPNIIVDRIAQFVAPAFDAAGEYDVAERIDAAALARPGEYNGANLATLRAARRAKLRGDKEAAKTLAKRIVDAWGSSDVELAAVVEMRALIRSAP